MIQNAKIYEFVYSQPFLNYVRIIYQFLKLTFAVEVDEKLEFMIESKDVNSFETLFNAHKTWKHVK